MYAMTHSSQRLQLQGIPRTAQLAEVMAAAMGGGEVLAQDGDLGAGKTTFTRELTRALGCSRLANSPTFSLFQRYRGGRLPVLHGDFYRLNSEAELEDVGWGEMLEEYAQGLVVVEWASRFPDQLPPDHLHLLWQPGAEDDHRTVELRASGPRSQRLLRATMEAMG
jgi:tRNA threonylcarbamoyladenosine biosynthesis protein TsaE